MFKPEKVNGGLKINNKVLDNISDDFIAILVATMKSRIKDDLTTSLTSKNFSDEALDYLYEHSIDVTDELVEVYSAKILDEFLTNFDDLIVYDETEHKVLINQSLSDFEFGTPCKPLLKVITRAIELSLKDNS